MNARSDDDGLDVSGRSRRRPRQGRRHARVPGGAGRRPAATTAATSLRRTSSTRSQGDGNFHFLSEAEAINRDLGALAEPRRRDQPEVAGAGRQSRARSRQSVVSRRSGSMAVRRPRACHVRQRWRNRERIERDLADPVNQVENKFRTINQVSATGVAEPRALVRLGSPAHDEQLLPPQHRGRERDLDAHDDNFQIADGQQLRDYDIRYRAARAHGQSDPRPPRERRRTRRSSRSSSTATRSTGWCSTGMCPRRPRKRTSRTRSSSRRRTAWIRPRATCCRRRFGSRTRPRTTVSRSLRDEVDSSGWDLMKPFTFEHVDVEISGGQDVSQKARSYTQTQFGLGTTAGAATPILVGHAGPGLHG